MYFLNPIFSAISLKHCLHKCKLYLLICAPYRPQLTHFFEAMPNFLSFGLQNLKNLALTAGLLSSCFIILLQSLAGIFEFFYTVCLIYFKILILKFFSKKFRVSSLVILCLSGILALSLFLLAILHPFLFNVATTSSPMIPISR